MNMGVGDQNVADYNILEPFKTYFKTHKIMHGRGDPI